MYTFDEYCAQFPVTAFVVSLEGDVLHMVGYSNVPSNEDRKELIDELAINEEFGFTDLIYSEDYQLMLGATEPNRSLIETLLGLAGDTVVHEVN